MESGTRRTAVPMIVIGRSDHKAIGPAPSMERFPGMAIQLVSYQAILMG